MQITTIGLDIAKNVFQVHGIVATEKVVVRKQLRRGQVIKFFEALAPSLIGMEACATAHHWARELTKLGHQVRLMPAKDVKAYVKRNKNDAASTIRLAWASTGKRESPFWATIANNSLTPSRPCAAAMPSSAKCARKALINWVRCRISRSRTRCCINRPCCSGDLTTTNRMVGRLTASQIASASAASFLLRLT